MILIIVGLSNMLILDMNAMPQICHETLKNAKE